MAAKEKDVETKIEITRNYPKGIVGVRGVNGKKSEFIAKALLDLQQINNKITENDIKIVETKNEVIVTAYI